MKHYFAIALFALLGLAASAQTNESADDANSETKMEERLEKIKTELSLSMEQESKLREAMKVQMEDLKTEKKKIRDAEKAMKEINNKYHESLSGFLSEDQMNMLKEMKPNQDDRQAREQSGGGKKGQK